VSRALILDFDDSVRPLPGADVVALNSYQEAIRFGCRLPVLRSLRRALLPALDAQPRVVFMGSGDYHHISYLLIERLRSLDTKIQVVVFDNHPDNMRYPFGIHCGSWVWHVSRLPFVARVHVVGITSSDVQGAHILENHLAPLYSGKVVYWCVQPDLRAMRFLGIRHSRSFISVAELLVQLQSELAPTSEPVYLSIDKDVLSHDVIQTNWDQGVMRLEELEGAVRLMKERIIGSDVTGDVSSYRYRSRFKRILSGLDHQPQISDDALAEWQARHQEVNLSLLSLLSS
jgi:arginase family enzyme